MTSRTEAQHREQWDRLLRMSGKKQAAAHDRLKILVDVEAKAASLGRMVAMRSACREHGVGLSSLYEWQKLVRDFPRQHWLPYLAPRNGGSKRRASLSPEAWSFFLELMRLPTRMPMTAAIRALEAEAKSKGWSVPSAQTLRRRLMESRAREGIL